MENLDFNVGQKRHLEKTVDNYILYCEKNPTLLSLKISKFFTIIDSWTWMACILISSFLGITKLGGYSDIAATFLRVSVISG